MKVKLLRPEQAAGLRDPVTKRRPFIDPDGAVILEAVVPGTTHWDRRVLDGTLARIDRSDTPMLGAPLAPLATR